MPPMPRNPPSLWARATVSARPKTKRLYSTTSSSVASLLQERDRAPQRVRRLLLSSSGVRGRLSGSSAVGVVRTSFSSGDGSAASAAANARCAASDSRTVPPRCAAMTFSAASDGALDTTAHSSASNAALVVMALQSCAT